jgi:MFS transporter, MCT family, solute carrier family 16 (monocarboxylic acid transporters), member 10
LYCLLSRPEAPHRYSRHLTDFYTQLYAININVPATTAFYSLAILNGGSFAGRIIIPYFADRYGVYNLLIPALFASAALDFSIFAIRDFGGVAAFGVFFGISSGACKNFRCSGVCLRK